MIAGLLLMSKGSRVMAGLLLLVAGLLLMDLLM